MTNVALVVLDTVRKDAFDRHFDWHPGTRFERAWSPSHWTVPVHASLFAGKYASELGVHAKTPELDCEEPTVAERLQDAGYTTRAFSANPQVCRDLNYDRGFEEFEGCWRTRHLNREDLFDWDEFVSQSDATGFRRYLDGLWACLTDETSSTLPSLRHGIRVRLHMSRIMLSKDVGASTVLQRVRETDFGDREFFFVNLMEAHAPYLPPEEYRTVEPREYEEAGPYESLLADDVDPGPAEEGYDACVRYLSDTYRDIFDELTDDFDYVITLSDHGELLGEHGVWGHGYGVYPELTHVPLIVYDAKCDESVTRDDVVSLLDVHRTILDVADVRGESAGRNLLDGPGERECLSEYHGITHQRTMERLADEFSATAVGQYDEPAYGIATPEDYYGYETPDGFEERGTSSLSDPRERLDALLERLQWRHESGTETERVSEEMVETLEDLGYV